MDLDVIAGADVPTPSAGKRTLYIDSANGYKLSYKYPDGTTQVVVDAEGLEECCACDISKTYIEKITCALNSGMLSASEFTALVTLGFNVNANEITDANGNKSCQVTMGPRRIAVVGLSISPATAELAVSGTQQLTATLTPTNTTETGVLYVSSNPSIATVSASGLITGVQAGSCTITAYAASDNSIIDTCDVTVS